MRLGLLLLLGFCSAAFAADPTTAPAPAAPVAAPVVLLDLVRKADLIVITTVGVQQPIQPMDGGTLVNLMSTSGKPSRYLKGLDDRVPKPLFVPDEVNVTFTPREDCIILAKMDFDNDRYILLPDVNAKLPSTPEVIKQVEEAVQKTKPIEITMTSDKPAYVYGDRVRLIWRIKNVSPDPVRIYTGPDAYRTRCGSRAGSLSSGSDGSETRFAEDYRLLPPGETFETHRIIFDKIPEGDVSVGMAYRSSGNWIGHPGSEGMERLPDVILVRQETNFTVKIGAQSPEMISKQLQDLKSPDWDVQLAALKTLVKMKQTASLPEVKAMAAHPLPAIRAVVATAYSLNPIPADETLRSLIYDPSAEVRNSVVSESRRRRGSTGSGLYFLALKIVAEEAMAKGLLPEDTRLDGLTMAIYYQSDAALGDLLAARMDTDSSCAFLLGGIVGINRRELTSTSGGKVSDDIKREISEKWAERRKTAGGQFRTEEELRKEVDECRKHAFADFKVDPRIAEICAAMRKLHTDMEPAEADVKAFEAFGPGIVPTTLFILDNWDKYGECESAALVEQYRDWKAKEAVPYVIAMSYASSSRSLGHSAPVSALLLDKDATHPHLEVLYTKQVGAAIALGYLGEKRAVPYIMKEDVTGGRYGPADQFEAIKRTTGKTFATKRDLFEWWRNEGSKQEWR